MLKCLIAVTLVAGVIANLPSAASADATATCTVATAHAEKLKSVAPIEVDSVSNTTGAVVDCEAKRLAVARTIDLKHAHMEPDFQDFLTKQVTDHACADAVETSLINSGWSVVYANSFSDGVTVNVTVVCK